jgi:hypothetical protein
MSKKWQPRRVAVEKGTPVRLACKPLKNRGGRHVYAGPMQVCMQVAVSCVRNRVLLDVEKRGKCSVDHQTSETARASLSSLEQSSLDNALFVFAQVATALLLGPQLTAYSLPAVSGSAGQSVVLATTCAWAGCAAARSILVVGMVEISHGRVAHGRSARRGEGIAHARGAGAARVIGQSIAATGVARGETVDRRGRRGWLRVEA